MRVLGLDPGATIGWCVYDTDDGWVAAGTERYLGFPTIASLLLTYKDRGCDSVAIEEPFVRGGTGPAGWAVGETCKIFGYARGRIEASGIECVPVAAGDWQRKLTGKGRGTKGMGKLVKARLGALGLLPKRSNEHERDACGIAWFAARLPRITMSVSDASQFDPGMLLEVYGSADRSESSRLLAVSGRELVVTKTRKRAGRKAA